MLRILLFLIVLSYPLLSQEGGGDIDFENVGPPPTVNLSEIVGEDEEDEESKPKKKRKKKVFYGIKTKKYFTKKGYGNNITYEQFYYPKKPVEPVPYVQEIYWYDLRRKQIRVGRNIDEEYGVVLHGPYQKVRDEQVLEKGIFYYGAKHGRWTKYSRNDILLDKEKYIKGWPKESRVSYYDIERTKLRELIPVEYGKKEGTYYLFFENGNIAVKGYYSLNEKVGIWTEYHSHRTARKREIQYSRDPYNDDFRPYIRREWDSRGKLIYEAPQIK